jgi:hypothetical protein
MIVRYRRSKYKYPDVVTNNYDNYYRLDLNANTAFNSCLTVCSVNYLNAQFNGLSDSVPPKSECIASCTNTYMTTRCPYATSRLTPSNANGDPQDVVTAFNSYKSPDMSTVSVAYTTLLTSAPGTSTSSSPNVTLLQNARKADLSGPTRKYLSTVCPYFYQLPDGTSNPSSVYTGWTSSIAATINSSTSTSPATSVGVYGFNSSQVTLANVLTWARRAGQPLKVSSAFTTASTSTTSAITLSGYTTNTPFAVNIPVNFPSTYKGSSVTSTNQFPVLLTSPDGLTTFQGTLYYSGTASAYGSGTTAIQWTTLPTFTLTIPAQSDVTKQTVSLNNYQICIAPGAIYVSTASTSANSTASLTINSSTHNIPSTYNGQALGSTNTIPLTFNPVVSGMPTDIGISAVSSSTVTIKGTGNIPSVPAGTVLQLGSIPFNTTDPTYPYAMPLDSLVSSTSGDLTFSKQATIIYPTSVTQYVPNWIANQSYGPGTITGSSASSSTVTVTFS